MTHEKKVIIIAGPNGAGKTTFARVAERVKQGGHNVAEDVIRRRFAAGMRHFLETYRQRVDDWMWFDNSGLAPVLVDEGTNP